LVFSDYTKGSFTFNHNADISLVKKSKDRGEISFFNLSSELQNSLESTAIVFFQNIKIKLILEKIPQFKKSRQGRVILNHSNASS
jgi:hypothetical protein